MSELLTAASDKTAFDTAHRHTAVLAIENLGLGFDGVPIILIPAMKLFAGEVVSIVGRSGSGKTTVLSCLSGHLSPTQGRFFLDGAEKGKGLRATFVSRTLQNFPLLHWHTVRGNLALAARIRGVVDPNFDEILASFSAQELADRYPSSLSGGERCRASLSQALLGDPRLLLLDEPFSGLDTIVKQIVAENLFRLAKANGAGVLFVTHDLFDAVEFSDRVIVIGSHRPATVVGEVRANAPEAVKRIRDLLVTNQ
jgi:NitT/TauT family transport system ATP-binding protein